MEIQIQSIHFSPSEALNEKIEQKLQKFFGQYSYISKADVFLKLQENEQKEKQIMEIHLSLSHGELFAKAGAVNFYKALDQAIHKLKKQLDKYKEKTYTNP